MSCFQLFTFPSAVVIVSTAGMTSVRSHGTVFRSLSRKHGLTCVPPAHVAVKSIIIAVGGIIGDENVVAASRMNKKVVVFVLQERMVASGVESGISVEPDIFIPVSPLDSPSVKVIISTLSGE